MIMIRLAIDIKIENLTNFLIFKKFTINLLIRNSLNFHFFIPPFYFNHEQNMLPIIEHFNYSS